MLRLVRVRVQQQQAFLLLNAGQVEKVGVLLQRQNRVPVDRENIIGIDRRQRVGRQAFLQIGPVQPEQFLVDRRVSHRSEILPATAAVRNPAVWPQIA